MGCGEVRDPMIAAHNHVTFTCTRVVPAPANVRGCWLNKLSTHNGLVWEENTEVQEGIVATEWPAAPPNTGSVHLDMF